MTSDPFPPGSEAGQGRAEEPSAPRRGSEGSTLKTLREWTLVVAGALAIALVVRAFLLAAFYIPSESMVPTLETGDRVLVNKLSYRLHDVGRGDVVVFERPQSGPNPCKPSYSWAGGSDIKDLIKRVVGLPGDRVEGRGGRVLVNGQELVEPYLSVPTSTFEELTVPDGCLFVMGDNRPYSQDSRVFGPIPEDLVVGRAFVRVWPLTHLGWL